MFFWILSKIAETALGKMILDALAKVAPKLFGDKNEKLIGIYEKRIKEANEKLDHAERSKKRQKNIHQKEKGKLIDSLKRRSIATEKLIDKYYKPLNAIIICYSDQGKLDDGKTKKFKFVMDKIVNEYNGKYLGGANIIIPPTSVPEKLNGRDDLKKWFDENILQDNYCKVNFLVLFDIKNKAYWHNYLPYEQKSPRYHTIGEVLDVEDVFTPEQVKTIAISEIISEGDIAWLASSVVSSSELKNILQHQKEIEQTIGNLPLRVLAKRDSKKVIISALEKYVSDPECVAEAIINEALFWSKNLK